MHAVEQPGHLAPMLDMRLADITSDAVVSWLKREQKRSVRQATRAAAMLSGFLRWCSQQPEYRDLVHREAALSSSLPDDLVPAAKRRTDHVDGEQLPAWFEGVSTLRDPVQRVLLKMLLLTGARRESMASLRWRDVDLQHDRMALANKSDATSRVIPLAPYGKHLLTSLPRSSEFVFAAETKTGYVAEPRSAHERALKSAGLEHVSIHGLRRSFMGLAESAGAPDGAIRQIAGHAPRDVHEGYKTRSVADLRPHMERIERFILDRAGIAFDAAAKTSGGLRLVPSQGAVA